VTECSPITGATVVAYPALRADRDAAPRPSSPTVTGRLPTTRGSLDRSRWVLSSSPPLRRSVVHCSSIDENTLSVQSRNERVSTDTAGKVALPLRERQRLTCPPHQHRHVLESLLYLRAASPDTVPTMCLRD